MDWEKIIPKKKENNTEDILIRVGEIFLKGFKDGYFDAVESKYSSLDENDNIFPLNDIEKYLNFNIIIVNKTLFDTHYYIVILDNSSDKIIDKSDDDIKGKTEFINTIGKYDYYKYINYLYNFENKLYLEIFSLHGLDELLDFGNDKDNLEYIVKSYYKYGKREGREQAGFHFAQYNSEMNTPVSELNHEPSIFNILKIDDMIKAVNDENFEYQMKEAVEVFKNNHYLPAAATFCVALETLLIIFKQRSGIKHKASDSSIIKDLVDDLSTRKKINYRENKRLDISYHLRNTINHSNIGMVAREDCLFIINTMRTFIDDHRDKFNQNN